MIAAHYAAQRRPQYRDATGRAPYAQEYDTAVKELIAWAQRVHQSSDAEESTAPSRSVTTSGVVSRGWSYRSDQSPHRSHPRGRVPATPSQPVHPAGCSRRSPSPSPRRTRVGPVAPRAAISRRWDLVWLRARWDGNAVEGSAGGRGCVALASTSGCSTRSLSPPTSCPPTGCSPSGPSLASQRAMDDLLEVQRVLMLDAAWSGVAMAYVPTDEAITIDPVVPNTVTSTRTCAATCSSSKPR